VQTGALPIWWTRPIGSRHAWTPEPSRSTDRPVVLVAREGNRAAHRNTWPTPRHYWKRPLRQRPPEPCPRARTVPQTDGHRRSARSTSFAAPASVASNVAPGMLRWPLVVRQEPDRRAGSPCHGPPATGNGKLSELVSWCVAEPPRVVDSP